MTELSKKDFLATQNLGELKPSVNFHTITPLIFYFADVKTLQADLVAVTRYLAQRQDVSADS